MVCHSVPVVVYGSSATAGPPEPPSNFNKWFPPPVPFTGLILNVMVLFASSDKSTLSLNSNFAWSQAWFAPTICKTSFSPSFTILVAAPSPTDPNWFDVEKSSGKLGFSTTSVTKVPPAISSTK